MPYSVVTVQQACSTEMVKTDEINMSAYRQSYDTRSMEVSGVPVVWRLAATQCCMMS